LRFFETPSGRRQRYDAGDESPPFSRVDLTALSADERAVAFEADVAGAQRSLNLATGPLLRVVLFEMGADEPLRLFLVFHHLAVDGVSWRILLEDLWTAYAQCVTSAAIVLPPKTAAFTHWAQRVDSYARSGAFTDEVDYWMTHVRDTGTLPLDLSDGPNSVDSIETISLTFTAAETEVLLRDLPRRHAATVHEALLAATARALCAWTGRPDVSVDVEGHGRKGLFDDLDLSRTVGWFTAIFPMTLDAGDTDPLRLLGSIKAQVRQVPRAGIGFGLLRYLSGDAELATRLGAVPRPAVSFNYLGQF